MARKKKSRDLVVFLKGDLSHLAKVLVNGQKKVGAWSKKIGSAMKSVGKKMMVLGGVMTGAMAGLVRVTSKFDHAMREVNTLAQLGEKDFRGLSKEVLALSSRLGVDAVGAAKALYQALSAGVPKENALTFLEVASKAAIGGVTDTETAVDGLTSIMNAWGMEASEVNRVADIMFTTVKQGKTTFGELSGSIYNVGPIANAAGVEFDEVAAALASITKQGVPTAVATTQLRAAIQAIVSPTVRTKKHFEKLGIATGKAALESKGLRAAFDDLVAKTGGDMEQMRRLLGSVEAVQAVLALTGENAQSFGGDLEAMGKSAGASQAAFEEMNRGFARVMEMMWTRIKTFTIFLGDTLTPTLRMVNEKYITPLIAKMEEWAGGQDKLGEKVREFAEVYLAKFVEWLKQVWDGLKPLVSKMVEWGKEHPDLTAKVIALTAVLGPLSLAFGPVLIVLGSIVSVFGSMTLALAPAGPLLLGLAGLTAAVLAFRQMAVTDDWSKNFLTELVDDVPYAKRALDWYFDSYYAWLIKIADAYKRLNVWARWKDHFWPEEGHAAGTGELSDIAKRYRDEGKISGFARGGLVGRSGLQLVGERGAELVRLAAGSRVYSHEESFGGGGGGGPQVVNHNTFGDVTVREEADIRRIGHEIARQTEEALRGRGLRVARSVN